VYMNKGMYKEAIEHLLKSLHYKELIHDKQNLPGTLLLLGNCYKELNQNDLALTYLTKAKNMSREIGNQLYLYTSYFVIAQNYTHQVGWDTAIVFRNVDSAIYLAQTLKDTFRIAFSKSVKADLMFLSNTRGADAERYSFEAMAIFEKRGSKFNMCNTAFSLGRYYYKQKRNAEAIVQLQKALALAKEVSATNLAFNLHKMLSSVYEQKGDFKTALFHHQQYFLLKDSVESGKLKADMVELEKKYTIGKKETEIAMLNKDKLLKDAALIQANTKQNFFLVTSLFLAAFIATGFWAYRKLHASRNLVAAKNMELDNLNQVKNRLFSIIAHDVKGLSIPFQRASRVLNHHIQKQNFEKTLEVAKQLETNAENLSNLLDNLLQWSLEQMNGYLPKPEMLSLKNEINSIIESYAGHAQFKKIEISQEIPDDLSIETDKGAFHVIFRNLVANAIKYTENGSIQIKAAQENKNIVCHVKDSGTGIDASVVSKLFGIDSEKIKNGTAGEKGSGLGLVLVKKFLEMNGGTIKVNTQAGSGTDFVISFPLRVAV
jgi:signal transduction histidine kinase